LPLSIGVPAQVKGLRALRDMRFEVRTHVMLTVADQSVFTPDDRFWSFTREDMEPMSVEHLAHPARCRPKPTP
jgi:hypothetical protein